MTLYLLDFVSANIKISETPLFFKKSLFIL